MGNFKAEDIFDNPDDLTEEQKQRLAELNDNLEKSRMLSYFIDYQRAYCLVEDFILTHGQEQGDEFVFNMANLTEANCRDLISDLMEVVFEQWEKDTN